jgi:probable F420-dependent oxidoreductase
VLILPQRQTVLVAKQAAEVDVLCEGRLRLGVGIGWNEVEYEALGEDFTNRGVRYEEQVELLRRLWTEEIVTFRGRFHTVDRAGILPMPVQRPIPLWMGGLPGARVLERIGRLADGWISLTPPGRGLEEAWVSVQEAAEAAGRLPGAVGLQGTIQPGADASAERIRRQAARWEALGATHLSVSGLGAGRSPAEHRDFVKAAAIALLG